MELVAAINQGDLIKCRRLLSAGTWGKETTKNGGKLKAGKPGNDDAKVAEYSPLHVAAGSGYFQIVDVLLLAGAKANGKDKMNNTPLHVAVVNNYPKTCNRLIAFGANVNEKGEHGYIALHVAALKGHIQIVALLLAARSDVNAKAINGNTPLHTAASHGYAEILLMLLDHEADISSRNDSGNDALHLAVLGNFSKVVEVLLRRGADVNSVNKRADTPLLMAASEGFWEIARRLLQASANPNAKGTHGATALHMAAYNGHISITELLLARGGDLELSARDAKGNSALHIAVKRGYLRTTESLLRAGIAVNEGNRNGDTALHVAARHCTGATLLIRLLRAGADARIKNTNGQTPLEIAKTNPKAKDEVIQAILAAAGSNVGIPDGTPTAAGGPPPVGGQEGCEHLRGTDEGREGAIETVTPMETEGPTGTKAGATTEAVSLDSHSGTPPSLLEDEPWKKGIEFSEEALNSLKRLVESYTPCANIGRRNGARILMVGQIGAGKSSFFNTVNSVFRGHCTSQAPTGSDPKSLTKEFRVYEVRRGRSGTAMNFRLCDTMGLEERHFGMDIKDFYLLLDGVVGDKFKFRTEERLSDSIDDFAPVTLAERIHVVAVIVDALTVDYLSQSLMQKIEEIKKVAGDRSIPVLGILTKIDMLCGGVKEDVTKVYHSRAVHGCIRAVSAKLGIPAEHILPVKNYEVETELTQGVNILALHALQQCLHLADGYLHSQLSARNPTDADPSDATDLEKPQSRESLTTKDWEMDDVSCCPSATGAGDIPGHINTPPGSSSSNVDTTDARATRNQSRSSHILGKPTPPPKPSSSKPTRSSSFTQLPTQGSDPCEKRAMQDAHGDTLERSKSLKIPRLSGGENAANPRTIPSVSKPPIARKPMTMTGWELRKEIEGDFYYYNVRTGDRSEKDPTEIHTTSV